MSVTVTQNPGTYTIARTLADYDVHHSEPPADPSHPVEEPNPRSDGPSSENNPEGWESEYRGVPNYRPTDTTLDFQSRNTPLNRVEGFFVWNMFGGIQMVHYLNWAWRKTGGKVNDTYFRYPLGGEY